MGNENGKVHDQRLESIKDDVHFVKETMIPLSMATANLSNSVDKLSHNIELMAAQLESFLMYQSTLSERYRKDIVKFAGALLLLIFGLTFGAEGAKKLVEVWL
jgi:hypothetical protein